MKTGYGEQFDDGDMAGHGYKSETPQDKEPIDFDKIWSVSMIFLIILIALFLMCKGCGVALADTISDDKAILAIIGEAENQGDEGMYAVACAIRNRGTLKGVYGLHAPRVKKGLYTKGIWIEAKKAWIESKDYKEEKCVNFGSSINNYDSIKCGSNDPTNGANAWENLNSFGKPYWADSCEQTVIIRDHIFYRCPSVKG